MESSETAPEFDRALLRADIRAGNVEAARLQRERVIKAEGAADTAPSDAAQAPPKPAPTDKEKEFCDSE